ncbi:MAG: ABC transporter ATP-binding protein [Butyricicoccus sp.]|nr:ABC transporter ATP-binding protein [Butyricicoccus sp.]
MASVTLKNVKKIYPNTGAETAKKKKHGAKDEPEEKKHNLQITERGVVAVQDFSIEIADKEFIVLVGPSGCGKSTTLRMIAGLEEITEGELYIGDRLVNNLPAKKRGVSMVFQSYALFPHMTVYDNIAFGLRMRHAPRDIIDKKVREAAEILDITEYLKRKPRALSGGQRQRVAIGRSIVRDADVFLMDEPLSNLDAKLRNQMRAELIKLRKKIDTTFVYVTHDQTEAMTLGDRIVIMKDGFIQQIGTPQEVFSHPKNLFVAGFIGMPQMNIFRDARLILQDGDYFLELPGERIRLPEAKQAAARQQNLTERPVIVGVRPAHTQLSDTGISAEVDVTELLGSELYVHLNASGTDVIAVVPVTGTERKHPVAGTPAHISASAELLHIFDGETEHNLF